MTETLLSTTIKQLRKDYDFVFLDCPPVEMLADSSIINRYVDRAAPYGTGQFKVGGNYAAVFTSEDKIANVTTPFPPPRRFWPCPMHTMPMWHAA